MLTVVWVCTSTSVPPPSGLAHVLQHIGGALPLSEGGQAGLQPLEQQTNIIFTVFPCRWGGKLVVRGRDEGGLSK